MPESEIWVKLGGDKGGISFKMSLHPNSIHNTFVFSCYQAGDSCILLGQLLEAGICDDMSVSEGAVSIRAIENLSSNDLITYSEKTVKVFFYGDYDFQCKMFGLSGASGKCYTCTDRISTYSP